jgi:carboxyl-terminal processing protease
MRRLIAALLLAVTPLAAQRWANVNPEELSAELRRFLEVYAAVEQNAAAPPAPEQAIFSGAIPGMLRQLDPHSVFFDPAQFEQLKQMEQSTTKGFGSVVSVAPGRVIVLQTMPGSPSAKAGLMAGDEIVGVNAIALSLLEMEQIVEVLSRSRQEEAQLLVRRQGTSGLLQFKLVPEEMQSPSVDRSFLLREGIGFVRITSFEGKTPEDLYRAVEKLGGTHLRGLVLDLRDNPGGVMDSALSIAALFLKPGTRLLTARGRASDPRVFDVPKEASPYPFKLAVLVNGRTGSASEIVAGAVQDNDRGVIIGQPTYGKGLVQSVYPLGMGAGVALTTAFYYTPSGRSIQRPLRRGILAAETQAAGRPEYKTASGRVVLGGGGIEPDQILWPPRPSQLGMVIEATSSFTAFATEYLATHKVANTTWEVPNSALDAFQVYLSNHEIRPAVSDWSKDREWIRARLRQEIFNQALGVEFGDEIELRRDPLVRRALEILSR